MTFGLSYLEVRKIGISKFDLLHIVSIHVFGYTTAAHSVLPFITAVTQNGFVQGGTRFASARNVFPRLDSVSIRVSGYTTAVHSVLPFITAVAQKGFLALVNST